MAELNDRKSARFLSTAAALLTLEIGHRFQRHYREYRSESDEKASRSDLLKKCETIRSYSFSLHNLSVSSEYGFPFMMVLARKISDHFDQLHNQLLLFDPDDIYTIIPVIDKQRNFWRKSDRTDFYGKHLENYLEHTFSVELSSLKNQVELLPRLS
ncbi:MAG: hypothetical protein ACFCU6_15880 [Balneolaceae bacterium]